MRLIERVQIYFSIDLGLQRWLPCNRLKKKEIVSEVLSTSVKLYKKYLTYVQDCVNN